MAAAAALMVLVAVLQARIDPLRRQPAIEPPKIGNVFSQRIGGAGLPFEYTLGAFSGFRQVIAGLLWVRADSFFHSGNYDAILPLIRMITWLDPNFLDVYATGGWHLMYNFTDTDQRSDRRYLPAGMALLREGIANNPTVFDMYKEAGWNSFDKVKDFDAAIQYYSEGLKQKNADVTQVGHALAHSLERAGRIDEAIEQWEKNVALHRAILDDPKAADELKSRHQQGYNNSLTNLRIMKVRRFHRPRQTQPPIEARFQVNVVRIRPKVLEVSGQWNLIGAKAFDAGEGDNDFGRGILVQGPVDGGRVDVRLHDAGYTMPEPKEFSFEVDPSLTIMQDALSTTKGKQVRTGGLYVLSNNAYLNLPKNIQEAAVYGFSPQDLPKGFAGVPIRQALAGGGTILSDEGRRQVEAVAGMPLAQLRADAAAMDKMTKEGYHVARQDLLVLGKFKREIDMSKDPNMYSFAAPKYDLIISFNPRNAPDFVQDRFGWSGEGLTDAKYLEVVAPKSGIGADLRMLRRKITLTKEDILGEGKKVLVTP